MPAFIKAGTRLNLSEVNMSKIRLNFLTLSDCERLLKSKDSKKLKNNTYLIKDNYQENTYHVRYWSTDILTISEEGWFYRTGGYETVTTKERLNQLLPAGYYISQKNFVWYLSDGEDTIEFDGHFQLTTDKYFEKKIMQMI